MNEGRPPIVANLLTGFLGAGKTTLLNRLLRDPALADTAVLINEFGEVGLDHLLAETISDDVVLLKSGCVCCSLRGDLKDAVLLLFDRVRSGDIPPFSKIVVETTGLADPVPLVATLDADTVLRHHFRMGRIITVVDVPNGAANIAAYDEAARQVAVADRIVLSKTEFGPPEAVDALQRLIGSINPAAPVVVLDEGDDVASLLAIDAQDDPADRSHQTWSRVKHSHRGHAHGDHRHAHMNSVLLEADEPLEWPRFAMWLSMLMHRHGQRILRLKGLVHIEGSATPLVVQGVQHIIHRPVHLAEWPTPRPMTQLVLIGENLDAARLRRSFASACLPGRLPANPVSMAH